MSPRRRWTLLALLYMAGIFALSSVPDDHGSAVSRTVLFLPPQWQNLMHVPLFFGLAWLLALAFSAYGWRHAARVAFLVALAYGCLDEFHQSFVYGRFSSATDALLDGVGAFLGAAAFRRRAARS